MNSIKLIYKFVFRNSIFDTSFGLSRFRLSVIQPLFENTLSQDTEVESIHNRFLTTWYNLGKMCFFPSHHWRGFECLGMYISCIYISNSTMPRELLRFVLLDISAILDILALCVLSNFLIAILPNTVSRPRWFVTIIWLLCHFIRNF